MIQTDILKYTLGYIGGRWTGADSGQTIGLTNPATGEELAKVPKMGRTETERAIACAAESIGWEEPIDLRKQRLLDLCERMEKRKEELGRIITLEHGKVYSQGIGEVEYAIGFFRFFAEALEEVQGYSLEKTIKNCRWQVRYRPAGVAGLIVPWNFPLGMLAKKLGAALAVGCSVIIKPSILTPLSAIALCRLMEEVGFPAGRVNVVTGKAKHIAEAMYAHPAVRILSFTGSTEIGKELIRNSAAGVKRLSLELGGNAPFIVFEDADLQRAADELMGNKFRGSGQTCVCANRVYVHQAVSKAFEKAVVERVKRMKTGNGLDPQTSIGPLINRDGFDKVTEHVQDALSKGARRLFGEDPARPPQDWGCFYPPVVLTGVIHGMRVFQEETFGPLIAMSEFVGEEEVVEKANDTCYGLAAYVFSGNSKRLERIAKQLIFGHVGLNTGTGPTPEAPFGGMKESGFGREGGIEGLHEFIEIQTTVYG